MSKDKIVVFDDPISSLDNDILFIVSTLIRKICNNICDGVTNVKQVFIFTHNIYFHKEVSYSRKSKVKKGKKTFWVVKKHNGTSFLENYDSNPIKSSYELLWDEVKNRHLGKTNIQNVLRRILESYFMLVGGLDLDDLCSKFEGDDRIKCRSLLSWVHDGSHSAFSGLDYSLCDDVTLERNMSIFKQIFDLSGHSEHYNMMMGESEESTPSLSPEDTIHG